MPSNYDYWSSTFLKLNPDHQHIIWDDADNREFVEQDYPWFLEFYDSYPKEIFRADMIRFFFLFKYGGLYVDMDTECLRPLNSLLTSGKITLGQMGLDPEPENSVPNAIMASPPGQLFWLLAISMAMEKLQEFSSTEAMLKAGPIHITGPALLKNAIEFYESSTEEEIRNRASFVLKQLSNDEQTCPSAKISILEPSEWYPIIWNNPIHDLFRSILRSERLLLSHEEIRQIFPASSLVTYWTHSWA